LFGTVQVPAPAMKSSVSIAAGGGCGTRVFVEPPSPKGMVIQGGILNDKAISKPAPAYPPIAKAARASGMVSVRIEVDVLSGSVISASATSGHPLLQQAAVAAARQARFSPTFYSGKPVRVLGWLTYNFVLQ